MPRNRRNSLSRARGPLGDVRWYRDGTSAQLAGQPEALVTRKRPGFVVHGERKLVRFLPDHQFLKRPHKKLLAVGC